MAESAKRTATYADLQALPPNVVGEIIGGALVTHPRPALLHAAAANALSGQLTPAHQWGKGGPGGWIFLSEPELHLGPDIVVPDLAGWKRERLPALPKTAYVETPPDWICEILSDSTVSHDRGTKRDIYARADVSYLWLLDPREKALEVFRLTAKFWLLTATFTGDADVRAVPFESTAFPLSVFWPFDPPDVSQEQA
jgi:Uma2 family endonuclease